LLIRPCRTHRKPGGTSSLYPVGFPRRFAGQHPDSNRPFKPPRKTASRRSRQNVLSPALVAKAQSDSLRQSKRWTNQGRLSKLDCRNPSAQNCYTNIGKTSARAPRQARKYRTDFYRICSSLSDIGKQFWRIGKH